jgi:hypothetical protein
VVGVIAPYVSGRRRRPAEAEQEAPPPDFSETPHKEPEAVGGPL